MRLPVRNRSFFPALFCLNLTHPPKPDRPAFLALALLFVALQLAAQTTWTGASGTNWNTAANWTAGVPDANDPIVIAATANHPVIQAGTAAVAKSVIVNAGATLTISAAGSLSINGSSSGTKGMENNGTVTNNGSLLLGNLSALGSYGFQNAGTFNNNAGALLTIDRPSTFTRGLYNTSTGSVTNSGKMVFGAIADAGTDAIWNDGTFNNSGCSAVINIVSNSDILGTGGGATFTNSGTIIENSQYNSYITSNSGVIQNLNFGTFNIVTNTGLLTTEPGHIWRGCASTNWNTAANWHAGTVPTATNAVVIPDAVSTLIIQAGQSVQAASVKVLSGGDLVIASSAVLTIDGSTTDGLDNRGGTVINIGTISVGTATMSGGHGILNQLNGTFTNNAGAQINVDRTTISGVYNYNATFNNYGHITTGAAAATGQYGVVNQGQFTNNAGAGIRTDRSAQAGLLNQNNSSFTNAGEIILGANADIGQFGIVNWFTFNNLDAGEIAIDRYSTFGIDNATALTSGTLNNSGQITVGALGGTATGGLRINGTALFNNFPCGELIIYHPLVNNATLVNMGLLRLRTTAANTSVAMTNNGIIEYAGNTAIPNLTNNDVIVADLNAGCGPASPALTIGSANSFSVATTWYKDAALTQPAGTYSQATNTFTPTNLPGAGSYALYFNVTDLGSGCTRLLTLDFTFAADATPPTVFCKNATVNLNAAGTVSVAPATVFQSGTDNCGTVNPASVAPSSFSCVNLGANTVTLTAADGSGNTATCTATVTIVDNTAPTVTCKNATVNLNAAGTGSLAMAAVFQSGSDNCGTVNQVSVSPNSFTCASFGINTVTLQVNDGHGNTATCTATVTVADNIAPTVSCKNATVTLNAAGVASLATPAVFQSGTDNCGTVNQVSVIPNNFNCTNIGTNTVMLTVNDGHGNNATCTATVTVADNIAPTVVCRNAAVNLSAGGNAGITTADVYQSGVDNCAGVFQVSVSPNSFSCANLGTNTVTLQVNDGHGNTATCTATVTVADNIAPTVSCKNATVTLNAAGVASLATVAVFQSGTDNCGAVNQVSVIPNNFNCTNLGTNTVMLTVNDGHGNNATCTATVTVADNIAPTVVCQNAAVNLSAGGSAGITTASVYQSGVDNCAGVFQVSVSPNSFTCANLGTNTVTLQVNDGHGNTATCTATVTVTDNNQVCNAGPTAICQNVTVNAGASCTSAVAAGAVNNGSTDPENGALTFALSPAGPYALGATAVVLTATDNGGLNSSCTATITVADNTAPAVTCKNASVSLNAAGSGSIVTTAVYQSGSDNCGTVNQVSVSPNTFTCTNLGTNTVVLQVNDGHGNTASCTATVTVADDTAPTVVCKNATVNLDAGGSAVIGTGAVFQSGSDNCGTVNQVAVSPNNFSCANLGTNTVTLQVNDGHGNSASCTATVTVNDITAPSVTCKSAAVTLSAAGAGAITMASVYQSGSDNCGSVNQVSVSPNAFTCANLGTNTVTLTVNDAHGNTASCSATVTVSDNTAPAVACQNASVSLDAAGTATVAMGAVFQSGSDNCGTVNQISVSPNTFGCANLGTNTITLTVNDGHGNTATCTATVTVVDNSAPSVSCKNATVNLNAAGTGSVTTADVLLANSDNCGAGSQLSLSPGAFSCASLGANTVTLTASDGQGNTASCSAIVTVVDNTAPVVVCQNRTVALNAAGAASIAPAELFQSGSDNCGTVNQVSVSPNAFTCANLGANTVTLQVNDGHGNTASCTATVTVADNTAPLVTCKNATVSLNAAGSASVTAATVFQSGSDNCGTVNPQSVAPASFGCAQLGANTVTLTANDGHGNTASCTATVTVTDNTAPNMLCQNLNISLSAAGSASITAAQVNNGSADNCGLTSMTVAPATVSCANLGQNTVLLTGTDLSGNSAQCQAIVTVVDITAPQAKCRNATVQLGANGSVTPPAGAVNNGSTDGCGIATMSLSPATFTCANVGTPTVVSLKVTDAGGNTSTCSATITVQDLAGPTALCKNPIVYLDDEGHVTITPATVNNGSSDPCGLATMTINFSTFNCSDINSPKPVILTVKDVYNNTSTCTAQVSIKDNIAPEAICENTTVALSPQGYATVYTASLAGGSSDNCSVWSYTPTVKVYTAASIGVNNLTITAKDWAGNAATCVSQVTVLPYGSGLQDDRAGEPAGEERKPHLGLLLFPNPADSRVTLSFDLPEAQSCTLSLFDLSGRLMLRRNIDGQAGANAVDCPLELPEGLYLLDLQAQGLHEQKRLSIQHER
jgi:hypothetical protein